MPHVHMYDHLQNVIFDADRLDRKEIFNIFLKQQTETDNFSELI